MKKKVLLVGIVSMLFMGIVNASSINGEYKGNPVVNVLVNGKIVSSEVPAIIYNGSTLIPLRAAVESLGARVSWDASTYTANITSNNSNETFNKATLISNMLKDNQNATKWNARNVKYVVNELGSYVMVDVLATSDTNTDLNNIATVSVYLADTDGDMIFVNYYNGSNLLGFYTIYKEDVEKLLKSNPAISVSEYTKFWKWNPSQVTPVSTNTILPTDTNDVIESTIDGEFTGWTGDTLFKLSNGQIWEQTDSKYYYYYYYMPKVTIFKDGSLYKMMVKGIDDKITVKRIK